MTNVLIVYATDYGSTKKMAEAVADGINSSDQAKATVKEAEKATVEDMQAADAVMVGSPVHMGSPDWRVKKFIDTVCSKLWMEGSMTGKVGAVFTTGSGFGNSGGGSELTMLSMMSNIAELGMIIVPFPKSSPGYPQGGLQWGPHGRTATESMEPMELSEHTLAAARHHGANVVKVAQALGRPVDIAG